MIKFKRLTIALAALLITSATAWADGTLLTTITASADFQSGSKTFDNIATVTLDGNFFGTTAWDGNGTITVTPAAGVTITSVKFISSSGNIEVEDTTAPFQAVQAYDSNLSHIRYDVDGVKGDYAVKTIEVYGTAGTPLALTEVTKGKQWQIAAMPAANVTLNVEYEPELTATFKAANALTIEAGKATVSVTENGQPVTTATLDADGKLTPVYEGQTITLTAAQGYKFRKVEAKKKSAAVNVTAITLNKTATTIQAGNIETLSVTAVTPDDATDQTVTWSSDNDAVATVDDNGLVTAVALGTANITATANDGSGVTATCAVTVSKVVTINQSDWGSGSSFTKDGVTVSARIIDPDDGNLMSGGSFSTTLGNFTKIVVTTEDCDASGTGWSGSGSSMTWEGTPASTVSFSGNFMGMGIGQTTIVCTIVPAN